jgi:phosphonate transport system substrate-binding protein
MQRLVGALISLLLVPLTCAASSNRELVFGVYPYLSPNQIVAQFTPLNDYLTKALERPVTLSSAPNFESFIKRTHGGEYDIIFTAPHMGLLAENRDGYRILVQSGSPILVVSLVKKDSPIKSLDDLRGRKLAVGAKMSMTYQIMQEALGKKGLALGKSVTFIDTASFSNVLEAVLQGEADAGATVTLLWDNAPAEKRGLFRELYRAPPVPGFFLLAHPRVGEGTLQKLQKALINFANTPDGKTYFAKTGQIDFRLIDDSARKRISPFTAVFDEQ